MKHSEKRKIYLAFDFDRDAIRRSTFLSQAKQYCEFELEDLSLPEAVHDERWQRKAKERIKSSDFVIVLLGQDTHSAPGVKDEVSLSGEVKKPVIQLRPQKKRYAEIGKHIPVIVYKWSNINKYFRDTVKKKAQQV